MKIDSNLKPVAAPASGGVKAKPASGSAGSPGDAVSLSAAAGQLQSGAGEAPIDSARVAEIRQAIAEGRFTINAGAIADSLIATARELVSSQRKA